jgi:heat shock protein HslJ
VLVAGHPVTLTVADSRISGQAGCNSYGGKLSGSNGRFALPEGLTSTMMACTNAALGQLERAYVAALQSVQSASVTGQRLVLRGPHAELTFTRVTAPPPVAVEGTTWTIDTLRSGATASTVRHDLQAPTLRLASGVLQGSTGCRGFTARYALSTARLTVTALQFAAVTCAGDTGPRSQDALITAVLQAGSQVSVQGSRLTLLAASGDGVSALAKA